MLQKRIAAYIIDSVIIVAPIFVFSLLYSIFYEQIFYSFAESKKQFFYILYLISLIFCLVGPLFKDVFGKRSVGKKVAKLKIVSENDSTPGIIQLIARNITFYIWPIEALLLLLDKKRLGDVIAKTKVVFEDKD